MHAIRPLSVAAALAAGCSGIGVGRSGAAYAPAVAHTESAFLVKASSTQPGWGKITGVAEVGWEGLTRGLFGFHVSWMAGASNASGEGLPGRAGAIFPWHATGTLGYGPFCVMLEYQKRTDAWNFAGGFGGELAANGYVGYVGFAPVPFLGVSVGGGKLSGELRAGDQENRAAYGMTAVDGMYAGVNLDAFLFGGGFLQFGVRPRLAIGYTNLSGMEVVNVPASYSGVSASLEAVFTVF